MEAGLDCLLIPQCAAALPEDPNLTPPQPVYLEMPVVNTNRYRHDLSVTFHRMSAALLLGCSSRQGWFCVTSGSGTCDHQGSTVMRSGLLHEGSRGSRTWSQGGCPCHHEP